MPNPSAIQIIKNRQHLIGQIAQMILKRVASLALDAVFVIFKIRLPVLRQFQQIGALGFHF